MVDIMREEFMDAKAFPRHHPSGQFGYNHPREIKLSPVQYYCQRLFNKDERFSMDSFYIFMAAAIVEKHGLERQIDIAGVKGKKDSIANGEIKVFLNVDHSAGSMHTRRVWFRCFTTLSSTVPAPARYPGTTVGTGYH